MSDITYPRSALEKHIRNFGPPQTLRLFAEAAPEASAVGEDAAASDDGSAVKTEPVPDEVMEPAPAELDVSPDRLDELGVGPSSKACLRFDPLAILVSDTTASDLTIAVPSRFFADFIALALGARRNTGFLGSKSPVRGPLNMLFRFYRGLTRPLVALPGAGRVYRMEEKTMHAIWAKKNRARVIDASSSVLGFARSYHLRRGHRPCQSARA